MNEVITITVTNRVLLLALDELYRSNMKQYEIDVLLHHSQELMDELSLNVADVPVEGYYTESDELTQYFLNVRTLQDCNAEQKSKVEHLEAYQVLSLITGSELYGVEKMARFFPGVKDSLSLALEKTDPNEWTIDVISQKALEIATELDDCSLVGIAASINDAVVLAALRESVVLYAAIAVGAAMTPVTYHYEWCVDEAIEKKVNRFIALFNELTSSDIKLACSDNAAYFYNACSMNDVVGRCVYIGYDDSREPVERYHWAIRGSSRSPEVEDFWSEEIWSTQRYQEEKLYN